MRRPEKIFALVLSDHHIMFPYTGGNDVSFVLWWKEHGSNGNAAKKAAKGRYAGNMGNVPLVHIIL